MEDELTGVDGPLVGVASWFVSSVTAQGAWGHLRFLNRDCRLVVEWARNRERRRRLEGYMSFGTGMKTIVVATDLNGQPEAALEYARKLAGMYGARIVLARGLDRWILPRWVRFQTVCGRDSANRRAPRWMNWPAIFCGKAYPAIRRLGRAKWRRCWRMWRGDLKPA